MGEAEGPERDLRVLEAAVSRFLAAMDSADNPGAGVLEVNIEYLPAGTGRRNRYGRWRYEEVHGWWVTALGGRVSGSYFLTLGGHWCRMGTSLRGRGTLVDEGELRRLVRSDGPEPLIRGLEVIQARSLQP